MDAPASQTDRCLLASRWHHGLLRAKFAHVGLEEVVCGAPPGQEWSPTYLEDLPAGVLATLVGIGRPLDSTPAPSCATLHGALDARRVLEESQPALSWSTSAERGFVTELYQRSEGGVGGRAFPLIKP